MVVAGSVNRWIGGGVLAILLSLMACSGSSQSVVTDGAPGAETASAPATSPEAPAAPPKNQSTSQNSAPESAQALATPAPVQVVSAPTITYDYGASSIRYEAYRSMHLLPRATVSSQEAELVEMVFASVDGRARLLLRHDPQLDVVAGVAAQFKAERRADVSKEVLQALVTRAGSTSQLVKSFVYFVDSPIAEQELAGRWVSDAAYLASADTAMSFGVARVPMGASGMAQAIVLGEERVLIDALPKVQAPGELLSLKGRMPPLFTNARVYVDYGDAQVESLPVKTEVDGSFELQIPMPQNPGTYHLEMNGLYSPDGAQGTTAYMKQQLLLPFYVGQPEPASLQSWIVHQYPNPRGASQWQSAYVHVYNQARAKLGLEPLRIGSQLGPLAGRHAKVVLHRGGLPTNREVTKELGARGVPVARLHRWNGSTTNIITAAHANLESPSHKAAVLSPDIREIGVGFAPDGMGGIKYVEYLMSVIKQEVGNGQGAETVALINQSRLAASLPGYVHMAEAQPIVQAYAEEVCKGMRPPEDANGIWNRLRSSGIRYARGRHYWSTSSQPIDEAFIAKKRDKVVKTPYTHMAVGTCQGELDGMPNRHYLLFIFLSLKP